MAKTKKVAKPQKALLMTAVKKVINANTVLPILEDILFMPGKAIVTDLETAAIIPFEMKGVPSEGIALPAKMFTEIMGMMESPSIVVNNGEECTLTEGKRVIKIMGDKAENFPVTANTSGAIKAGTINAQTMEHIATALLFVSNDDLRPSMTGVYFCEELVATDAHRLYRKEVGFTEQFIVPAKSLKALIALGGEWDVYSVQRDKAETLYVYFVRHDGTELISRAIDARFPDYKVVIPTEGHTVTLNMCPHILGDEVKNALKFSNKSSNMIVFTIKDSLVEIASQDLDFSFKYNNEVPATIIKHDVFIKKQTEEGPVKETLPHCPYIAFNGKYLLQVIAQHTGNGPVEIKLWSPTKCAIINSDYLLMPLMLND